MKKGKIIFFVMHACIVLLCSISYNPYLIYASTDLPPSVHAGVEIPATDKSSSKELKEGISNDQKGNNLQVASDAYQIADKVKQAIVVDYDTGIVIFEKNSNSKMTPSSMTKLMTLYCIFEKISSNSVKLDDKYVSSDKATMIGGSRINIAYKNVLTVEELIRAVAIQSANDASIGIAEKVSGSESKFAELMNETALSIGLKNSNFINSSGWPNQNHYSTASDLALLSIALIKNYPQYYQYFSEKDFSYKKVVYKNRNKLLDIDGIDGIKTGHTEDGGFGIVVSGVKDGRRIVVVVNGLKTEEERNEEALKMVQYGLKCGYKKIYSKGDIVTHANVMYGGKSKVGLIVHDDLNDILCLGDKNPIRSVRVVYYNNLKAPIEKGMAVGEVIIDRDTISGAKYSVPIYTAEKVDKGGFISRISSNLRRLFRI